MIPAEKEQEEVKDHSFGTKRTAIHCSCHWERRVELTTLRMGIRRSTHSPHPHSLLRLLLLRRRLSMYSLHVTTMTTTAT